MKKINLIFMSLSIVSCITAPSVTFALQANAGKTGITYECVDDKGRAGECDFNDLVNATVKLVNWAIEISIALSVIVIAYAGYLYMTSGGSSSQLSKANGMLFKVAQGIALMMAAWLIVHLIAGALISNQNVPDIIKN